MGVILFVVFDRDTLGEDQFDPYFDGRSIGLKLEDYDDIACRKGITPLGEFLYDDPEDLKDLLGDEADKYIDETATQWFDPEACLSTVIRLVEHIETTGEKNSIREAHVKSLNAIKARLIQGIQCSAQFHFGAGS